MELNMYGMFIGIGIVVAISVASRLLEMKGENGSLVWEGVWWVLIPGVVVARLYHVIDQWDYYRSNWELIWQLWQGGMGIMGGIAGGVVGLVVFAYLHAKKLDKSVEESFFLIADVVVMGALLAQAIGRWGNYFNRELYGLQTSLPWGMQVEGLPGLYHPLFLYESFLNLVLFVVLLGMYRKHERRGSVFGGYLIGYGLIRILLEGLRYESWRVADTPVARLVGLVFVLIGFFVLRRRRGFIKD